MQDKTTNFITKAIHKHGTLYSYDKVNFINSREKVEIFCQKHGYFLQIPTDHLSGKGCSKCASEKRGKLQRKTTDIFIEQSQVIHKNNFDYSLVEYITNNTKVKIKCKKHDYVFEQTPSHHLMGKNGCHVCNNGLCWSKKEFAERFSNKPCMLYIINCFNDKEDFYKIGITTNTVKIRYHSKTRMPYNYIVIFEYRSNAENIWELESELKHKRLKDYSYKPNISFGGEGECFKLTDNQLTHLIFSLQEN